MAALLNRATTGEGARFEVSLFETAMAFMGRNFQTFWEKGTEPAKCGSGHESPCPPWPAPDARASHRLRRSDAR